MFGFNPFSMVDSPNGTIASVVYTLGCNLRCEYCYNSSLVLPELFSKNDKLYDLQGVKAQILAKRSLNNNNSYFNKSDYIVISGGEPLLHYDEVIDLATYSSSLGFKVKVNTNATIDVSRLLETRLVDYVSLDLKDVFRNVPPAVGENFARVNAACQKKQILGFELHTVLLRGKATRETVQSMAEGLNSLGIKAKWYLVGFKYTDTVISKDLSMDDRLTEPEARELFNAAMERYDGQVILSGY